MFVSFSLPHYQIQLRCKQTQERILNWFTEKPNFAGSLFRQSPKTWKLEDGSLRAKPPRRRQERNQALEDFFNFLK